MQVTLHVVLSGSDCRTCLPLAQGEKIEKFIQSQKFIIRISYKSYMCIYIYIKEVGRVHRDFGREKSTGWMHDGTQLGAPPVQHVPPDLISMH